MIKPIKMEDIPTNYRQQKNRIADVVEFIESGLSCVEVFSDTTKNASSLYASLYQTIRRHNFPVSVILRGERVFLIKEATDGD